MLKKWFYEGLVSDYVKFACWIAGERALTIIAYEDIYIEEGTQTCFRCGKLTRVIGLGLENTQDYTAMMTAALKMKLLKIWWDMVRCFFHGT